MLKKILVFEDDDSIAELIRFHLEEEGYQVKIFLSLENYFENILYNRPDLITLDFFDNNGFGWEVFQVLKKDKRTQQIPVVIVSGIEGIPSIFQEMKPEGYITKPFDEKKIKTVINSILMG